ncbi:MAG: tetratricopeptide repeat protein, partial [Caulobacteraceae bacterium]
PRVLTAMGVVYDKLGRFDLSDRYYDQAEKADPGSRIVATDRRYSMFLRNAGKFGDQTGVALAQAETPAAIGPANAPRLAPAEVLYARSVKAIERHEYGVAIGLLRQARDAAPDNVRVLTALGVTYDHLGRFDLSSRYYDQAQKLDPGSTVLAQDRHTSMMLQRHGGFSGPDDIIVLAKAGRSAQTMRVAKVALRRGTRG